MKKKKMPIFKNFFISYALLVALPTIILASASIAFFYHTYRVENLKLFGEALSQQMQTFDDNIMNLDNITRNIAYNPFLSEGYVTASTTNQITAVQHVRSYGSADDFDAPMHVLYFNHNLIVTEGGTLSELYYLKKYNVEELEISTIEKNLEVLKTPYLLKIPNINFAYGDMTYAYIAPISPSGTKPFGAVLFLIKDTNVEKPLNNLEQLIDAPSFILDKSDKVYSKSDNASDELISAALASDDKNFKYNGTSYSLIKATSKATKLTFYSVTNPSNINENFILFIKVMGLSLVITLSLSSFLIYHFMMSNYKPLRIFERTAIEHNSASGKSVTLQSIVTNISERLDTLSKYYTNSIDQRTNQMLMGILVGSIADKDQLLQEEAVCNFSLTGKYFTAITLLFDHLSNADKDALQRHVSDFSEVQCYPVDIMKKNSLAYIISSEVSSLLILHDAVLSLQTGIQNVIPGNLTIGVGDIVSSPLSVYASYTNSLAALESRFIKGVGNIILFDEIEQQTSSAFQYPYFLVEQFKNALQSGNRTLIMDSIDSIFTKLKKSDIAIITTRTFCYNISQAAVRILSNGKQINSKPAPQDAQHGINRIMESETIDTLAENLKGICSTYLDEIEQSKPTQGGNHFADMKKYIAENYCDPDFSLQMMSAYFAMSPSYVSRYFASQNNGTTMLDYTNQLRMEKAKQLLRETSKTIPEIAAEVASLNLSSFNRKFKQIVGVPPGAYRTQQAQSEQLED